MTLTNMSSGMLPNTQEESGTRVKVKNATLDPLLSLKLGRNLQINDNIFSNSKPK